MFPEYCNEHPAIDVFGFNGFETIPAYRKMDVTDLDGLKQVSVKIRRLGENSCGFIENGKINFHTCDDDAYYINYENIFHKLLEIYSMRYLDRDIRNYKLLDVLLKVLKLEIQ